jgi:membrane protease subunit (stomatin/prohibitin family)
MYKVMVSVRAFGQYGVRIIDSKRFLLKLVGTVSKFDVATLSEYLRGAFITRIKTGIAHAIISQRQSVLEISTQLDSLSEKLKQSLAAEMLEYGIGLSQFNIHSINVPDDDAAMQSLKTALSRRAEMGIVGFDYQQERSFDVMEAAAGNEGSAGTMIGTGLGLGVGVAMGPQFGQAFGQVTSQIQPIQSPPANPSMSAVERIRHLKDLAELKAQGVLSDEEFRAEKDRILQG